MMAGNPSRWSMHPPSHLQPSAFLISSPPLFPSSVLGSSSSSSLLPFNSFLDQNQELPQSWSQLLLGGLSGEEEEEDRVGPSQFHSEKLENWDDKILNPYHSKFPPFDDVKQLGPENSNLYVHGDEEFQPLRPAWSPQAVLMPVSSPRSCVTTSNILDFSHNKADGSQYLDQSFECNSSSTGGVYKKPRVQPSSAQPPLKVRKEKLGDRITALHQLVSPFGKTDTASVLLEAIGYIRFLQGQIEALSSPYMGTTASSNTKNQQCVRGERNCIFPEDPGQDKPKDLRSRGLCLVPVSCTPHVGSDDNGSDYWTPAIGGGF